MSGNTDPEQSVSGREFQQLAPDWRVLDTTGAWAWFEAPSHTAAADLARAFTGLDAAPLGRLALDLRRTGLAVRLANTEGFSAEDVQFAQAVSALAAERGALARPDVPQELSWAIDTRQPEALTPFWEQLTGLTPTELDGFVDPDQRRPRLWFHPHDVGPLRNRLHFDISQPESIGQRSVEALTAAGSPPGGPYEVLHTDAEGNQVDLIVGAPLDGDGLDDWSVIFGAQVFYPTSDAALALELVTGAAALADQYELEVIIDLRPRGVFLDSGKDRWEREGFIAFAEAVQGLARSLGLVADPGPVWFFQVALHAVDIDAVRAFWLAVLGYEKDERESITDILDPRMLNHPLLVLDIDASEIARLTQRNRIHLDLYVADDQVEARRAAALAAGGRRTGEGNTIADPEGNLVDIGSALGQRSSHG